MVDAPDNIWAGFAAAKNSKDALQWRDRSFAYYDELAPLYEGHYAEGRTHQGMDHYASKTKHGSVHSSYPTQGTDLCQSPSSTMPIPSESDMPLTSDEVREGDLDYVPHLSTPRQHMQVAPRSTHISSVKHDTRHGKRQRREDDDGFHERYKKLKQQEIDRFAAIEEKKLEDPYNINKCITC